LLGSLSLPDSSAAAAALSTGKLSVRHPSGSERASSISWCAFSVLSLQTFEERSYAR